MAKSLIALATPLHSANGSGIFAMCRSQGKLANETVGLHAFYVPKQPHVGNSFKGDPLEALVCKSSPITAICPPSYLHGYLLNKHPCKYEGGQIALMGLLLQTNSSNGSLLKEFPTWGCFGT